MLLVLDWTDTAPTIKVQVAIAEVELAVKVIDSPSQNVDDDAEEAQAVEVKKTSGFTPTLIVMPGDVEEQPPVDVVVNDSTVTTCPSIRVLVTKLAFVERAPTG